MCRCDGEYEITICERGDYPPTMRKSGYDHSSRYGYISGMKGDQIMHASQAGDYLFIIDQGFEVCKANILVDNLYWSQNDLLIAVEDPQVHELKKHCNLHTGGKIKGKFSVAFEAKHNYFDLLHQSVESLSSDQIGRIMPNPDSSSSHYHAEDARPVLQKPVPYDFLELDERSQLPALEMIMNSSSEVPVLISGAFKTGKTHLLAAATYHFIEEGKQRRTPTRILICCHHHLMAEAFIERYFGKMVNHRSHPWRVTLARLTRSPLARYNIKSEYLRHYLNIYMFKSAFFSKYAREEYVVIVTSFLTALRVRDDVGDQYFTHILLDDATQVREPEAVAPFCMANQNTKIVIAGDDQQVRFNITF